MRGAVNGDRVCIAREKNVLSSFVKPGLKQANTSMSHDSLFKPFFFVRLDSFLRIQGWQTYRKYDVWGMSYFRTSVPF